VLAVRVWPAREYTRIALELDEALRHSELLVLDPPRLVVDLEGLELDNALRELVAKVRTDDPYIRQVRVGQYKPRVVRVVFDLKSEISPQVFALAPVANYGHRLVIDLYPSRPEDPLHALLQEVRQREARTGAAAAATPATPGQAAPVAGSAGPPPTGAVAAPRSPGPVAGSPAAAMPGAVTGPALASAGQPSAPSPGRNPPVASGASPAPPGPPATHSSGPSEADARRARHRQQRRWAGPAPARRTRRRDPTGHRGHRSRPRRRRSWRHRQRRHTRKGRGAGDCAASARPPEPGTQYACVPDPGCGFFRAAGSSGAKGTQRAGRSVRLDPCRCLRAPGCARRVRLRAVGRRCQQQCGPMAGRPGKPGRPHRRREPGPAQPQVAEVLLQMSTASQIRDSSNFARIVLNHLGGVGELHKPAVEQAGFAVLKAPDIPSVLVETAFISNPHEEKRLADPDYQNKVARAIHAGIRSYFVKYPPPARPKPT
jgi:N-acetylmuramoyl-L-alanine amidase